MDKENLITIGTLAKITGVHTKSLYYYEQIGILSPVYTDPQNSYRYYSPEQVLVVGWIQHFIDLGLPLKKLQDFISDHGHTIDSDALLSYEIEMTEHKIRKLQDKQLLLTKMKEELAFSKKALASNQILTCDFGEKFFKVTPLKPPFSLLSVQKELMRSFSMIKEADLTPGSEMGILRMENNGIQTDFAFLEILSHKGFPDLPDTLCIPAGTYQCITTNAPAIDIAKNYFPELYARKYDKTLIETTLLTSDFHPYQTVFQLRCSMPGIKK